MTIRTDSIEAGFHWQRQLFLREICRLFSEPNLEKIVYEVTEMNLFEDFAVFHKPGFNTLGHKQFAEYYQAKYHTNMGSEVTAEDFIRPDFLRTKQTLLQRLFDDYKRTVKDDIECTFTFCTNWDVEKEREGSSNRHPLGKYIDDAGKIKLEQLKRTPIWNSWVDHIRATVKSSAEAHDNIEVEFEAAIKTFRFQYEEPITRLRKSLNLSLRTIGLKSDYDRFSDVYEAALRAYLSEGRHEMTKELFKSLATAVNLWAKISEPFDPIIGLPAPQPSKDMLGRDMELAQLKRLLEEHCCIAVTGLHGVGKSALAAAIHHQRLNTSNAQTRTYWVDLNAETMLVDAVGEFLREVDAEYEPSASADKQAAALLSVLRRSKETTYFIVINNCEAWLSSDGSSKVDGFDTLLKGLIDDCGKAAVIFTSTQLPRTKSGLTPFAMQIQGLGTDYGANLLKRRGVRASKRLRQQASEFVDGHPQALILLAQLIISGRTLEKLLEEKSWWGADASEKLISAVIPTLRPEERELLGYLSVFSPYQADSKAVAGMLTRLPQPQSIWDDAKISRYAQSLHDKSLLSIRGDSYSLNNLVSIYARQYLNQVDDYHRAAAYYFRYLFDSTFDSDKNPPQKSGDILPLIWAFQHFLQAEDYQECYASLYRIVQKIPAQNTVHKLNQLNEHRILAEMLQSLDTAMCRKRLGERRMAKVLADLSTTYIALSQYRQAVAPSKEALRLFESIYPKNEDQIFRVTSNLLTVLMRLGDETEAQAFFHKLRGLVLRSSEIRRKATASNIRDKATAVEQLANACLYQGNYEEAVDYYNMALQAAQLLDEPADQARILSNIGYTFAMLGEQSNSPEDARRHYATARICCEEAAQMIQAQDLQGIKCNNYNTISLIFDKVGDIKSAIIWCNAALDIAEDRSYVSVCAQSWLMLAEYSQKWGKPAAQVLCCLRRAQEYYADSGEPITSNTTEMIDAMQQASSGAEWEVISTDAEELDDDPYWRPFNPDEIRGTNEE